MDFTQEVLTLTINRAIMQAQLTGSYHQVAPRASRARIAWRQQHMKILIIEALIVAVCTLSIAASLHQPRSSDTASPACVGGANG